MSLARGIVSTTRSTGKYWDEKQVVYDAGSVKRTDARLLSENLGSLGWPATFSGCSITAIKDVTVIRLDTSFSLQNTINEFVSNLVEHNIYGPAPEDVLAKFL